MARTTAVLALLLALAFGSPATAHAHFIWIETDAKAASGRAARGKRVLRGAA